MDNQIKEGLNKLSEQYSPSPQVRENILKELKGEIYMKKKINIKKLSICLGAAVLLLTATAVAGQLAAYSYSSASRADTINHAPTKEEVAAEVSYEPKYAEKLGDYTLTSAQPETSGTSDENHNRLTEAKAINFEYKNGDKVVRLFTEGRDSYGNLPFTPSPSAVEAGEVNGITLYYSKVVNKYLPPDEENTYTPTEEEKRQMEEGTLNISYGSAEEEIIVSEHLSWEEDGIRYSLMTMDNHLGADTLADMAEAVINS